MVIKLSNGNETNPEHWSIYFLQLFFQIPVVRITTRETIVSANCSYSIWQVQLLEIFCSFNITKKITIFFKKLILFCLTFKEAITIYFDKWNCMITSFKKGMKWFISVCKIFQIRQYFYFIGRNPKTDFNRVICL